MDETAWFTSDDFSPRFLKTLKIRQTRHLLTLLPQPRRHLLTSFFFFFFFSLSFRRRADRTAGRQRHQLLCVGSQSPRSPGAHLAAARSAARARPGPAALVGGGGPEPRPCPGRVPAPAAPSRVTPARLPPAERNPPAPGARTAPRSQTSRCSANFFPLALPCGSHTLLAPSLPPSPPKNFWSNGGNVSRELMRPTFGARPFPQGSPLDFPREEDQARAFVLPGEQQTATKLPWR